MRLIVGNFDVSLSFSPFLSKSYDYLNVAEISKAIPHDLKYKQVFVIFSLNPILEGQSTDLSLFSAVQVDVLLRDFSARVRFFLQQIANIQSSKIIFFEPPIFYSNRTFDVEYDSKNRSLTEFYETMANEVNLLGNGRVLIRSVNVSSTDIFNDFRYFKFGIPFSSLFLKELALKMLSFANADDLPPKKVVVVDCDNTLWGGIVGEQGPNNIKLGLTHSELGFEYTKFQMFLKSLRRRGFLLALCSKNNEADVIEVFQKNSEMTLELDDFSAQWICWENKATGLREISNKLSLGLSSFVFIDDSEFECELVRTSFPEVTVFRAQNPTSIVSELNRSGLFSIGIVSPEDLARAEFYKTEKERGSIRDNFSNFDDYVTSLDLRLLISYDNPDHLTRVAQLIPKTNQFILNEFRPDLIQTQKWIDLDCHHVFTAELDDKFGGYGVVGVVFVIVSKNTFFIKNMVLSCRALGRYVENSFIVNVHAWLCERYGRYPLKLEVQKMSKNRPAINFCSSLSPSSLCFDDIDGLIVININPKQVLTESSALVECTWK